MFQWIKKMAGDKREYRRMMARVDRLPEEYQYAFHKIQKYMWNFAAGDGMDMLRVQYGLIELFEDGHARGKSVLEVTGEDVAAFCDELLRNARTYTENLRRDLNRDMRKKLG